MAKSTGELLVDAEWEALSHQLPSELNESTNTTTHPADKENAAWMDSSSYITSEEASATEPSLDHATQLLIDCAAASIAANMLEQLEQAALISHQYTGNIDLMQGHTAIDVYDSVVRDSFHTGLQHVLAGMGGIKTPTIVVDVSGFLDGDNELIADLKRSNFSLVPVRLIQTSQSPLTSQSTISFTAAFSIAVKNCFTSALEALTDVRPRELFARQQMLHKGKHNIGEDLDCCLFKILEDDYRMPFDKSKLDNNAYKYVIAQKKEVADDVFTHMISEFSISCGTCGVDHEFKIVH
ncbi:hypothetical protein PMIN07_010405 [Paraphaeosphaeria minitans]